MPRPAARVPHLQPRGGAERGWDKSSGGGEDEHEGAVEDFGEDNGEQEGWGAVADFLL